MDLKSLQESLKTNNLLAQLTQSISGTSHFSGTLLSFENDCMVKSVEPCIINIAEPTLTSR